MKLNRIALSLVLALCAALATTGCKTKHTPPVTNVNHPAIAGPSNPEDFNTKPISPADSTPTVTPAPPQYTGGPIATPADWGDPRNMNQDREKFAANIVHFEFDSAVVKESEQANIDAVAAAMKADASGKLLIEGHCDERGTEEYNRSLGERRALALREALAKAQVNSDLVRTISFGKDKPADPGHDEAAWAKNRRGEFIWCTPKPAAQ